MLISKEDSVTRFSTHARLCRQSIPPVDSGLTGLFNILLFLFNFTDSPRVSYCNIGRDFDNFIYLFKIKSKVIKYGYIVDEYWCGPINQIKSHDSVLKLKIVHS